jgi:LemA protein
MGYTLAAVGGLILFMLFVGLSYNALVSLRNRFLNAFSQIDVQLKRRHDLIPNLVEAVKGYMAHERQTLEAVITARNLARDTAAAVGPAPLDAAAVASLASAESGLLLALSRFRMLSEAYPQLKADRNAADLFESLTTTENRIAFARQAYNDAATHYNTRRQLFPVNLVAGLFGFPAATLFEIDEPQRDAVAVQL